MRPPAHCVVRSKGWSDRRHQPSQAAPKRRATQAEREKEDRQRKAANIRAPDQCEVKSGLLTPTVSIKALGAAQSRKLWRQPRSWSASARASAPQARLLRRCRYMRPVPVCSDNLHSSLCGGSCELLLTQFREPQQPAQAATLPPRQERAPPQLPPVLADSSVAAAASAPHAVGAGASAQAAAAASDLPVQAATGSRPSQPLTHARVAAQQPTTLHAPEVSADKTSPPRCALAGGPSAGPEQGHYSSGGGGGWGGISGVLALGSSGNGGRRPAGP